MAGARGSIRRNLVSRLFGARNRRRRPRAGRRDARLGAVVRRGLIAVLGIAAGVAVWFLLRDAVRSHAYFAVREVVIRSHGRLAPDALRAAAGIESGMSIWDVDVPAAAARLRRRPWVRSARITRELPHRVVIQVREYRPAAILALAGRLYYVAANGRVFADVGPKDPHDLPYVTGLAEADLGGREAFGPRAIRRALALLRAAGHAPGVGTVSEIHVDRIRGLVLLPVRPTVPIEVGWAGFGSRLALLPPVLAVWNGREAAMTGVSLLFDGEVVVRTRPGKAAARRQTRT